MGQVSALYIAADSLPVGLNQDNVIAALHVSDIHDNPQAYDVIEQLHTQFAIDVVIDTGDIVSWGTPLENELLHRIGTLEVPYVYISGNHDGAAAAATVEAQPNTTVLDNEVVEVAGLRIAGIGDPRFAADDDSDAGGWREGDEAVDASVFQLGDTIEAYDAAHPEEPGRHLPGPRSHPARGTAGPGPAGAVRAHAHLQGRARPRRLRHGLDDRRLDGRGARLGRDLPDAVGRGPAGPHGADALLRRGHPPPGRL